jgi:hypothetical protein
MGGNRSVRKPKPAKKIGKKKNTGKKDTGKKDTGKKSNFHKKYNEYVTKLSKSLNIEPSEASSHLGNAMENAFNGLLLSKLVGNVGDDEYYSLKDDELQSALHPSLGASKKSMKKSGKCITKHGKKLCHGKGDCSGKGKRVISGKCKNCGNLRKPLSLLKTIMGKRAPCNKRKSTMGRMNMGRMNMGRMNMFPRNKRTFHLTPRALKHDNIKTNMSGYSETKVCESHNGSPLKCRTMKKRY